MTAACEPRYGRFRDPSKAESFRIDLRKPLKESKNFFRSQFQPGIFGGPALTGNYLEVRDDSTLPCPHPHPLHFLLVLATDDGLDPEQPAVTGIPGFPQEPEPPSYELVRPWNAGKGILH